MKRIGKLHVLTDTSMQERFSHLELTSMALAGGADTIQFRSKSGSTRELIEIAGQMKELCSKSGVPLIINDRVDIAMAVNADGVHLGQDDFPITLARKMLGPDAIIGGSAGTLAEAEKCLAEGADYIGSGPVYGTSSKLDAGPATGIDNIIMLAGKINLPIIAIGGVTACDLNELLAAGAYGVAVISVVCLSDDPEEATRGLRAGLDDYRKR